MLHWICALGDLSKANFVLSIPGVAVNAEDNGGWTPIMIAGTPSSLLTADRESRLGKRILWTVYWKFPKRT